MKRSLKAAMATAILMACLPALCVAQETVKNVQRYVLETRSDDDGGHGDHDEEHEYAKLAIQAKMSKYWLGVVTEALEGALKDHLDTDGLIIEEVVEDSPAAAAGLKANDIVVKVAGKKIADVKTLVEIIGDNGAKPMKIEILRKGRSKTMTATPAKRPQGKATDLAIPHEQILRFQPGMTMKWATPMAGADVIALADGGNSISITVEKNGEGPAKVKIQAQWRDEGVRDGRLRRDEGSARRRLQAPAFDHEGSSRQGRRTGRLAAEEPGPGKRARPIGTVGEPELGSGDVRSPRRR